MFHIDLDFNITCYQSIGAVNTIVRRPTDGKLVGYNTDCDACITAIEDALQGNIIAYAMI